MVVPGATILEVTSAKELLSSIQGGQNHRHVASTQVCPILSPFDAVANLATSLHTRCGTLYLETSVHCYLNEAVPC